MKKALAVRAAVLAAAAALLVAAPALASSLFGGAVQNQNNVTLVSNTSNGSSADDYSGINFSVPASTTLATLGPLMATWTPTQGDCGGGSPRFQINVNNGMTTANVFAYLGPPPNYTGCSIGSSTASGDLLGSTNASSTVDTSQLPGGSFYDTLPHALATFGSWPVTGVELVADGGWALQGGLQQLDVSSVTIGSSTYNLATSTGTTTGQGGTVQDLINALISLQNQFPNFYWNLQWVINGLAGGGGGTTTGSGATITNSPQTVGAGGVVDWNGRGFSHEEDVTVTLNGTTVAHAHADGGGNFTTGSLTVPSAHGTYTYVLTGASGDSATAMVTVP